MKRVERNLSAGIWTLPSFPIVLVSVGRNIMTAGALHFYSFEPPSLMVGIMPERYTHELITRHRDFGINLPTVDQIELVRLCGSVSGRDADKYERGEVTPLPGTAITSSLIAECPLNIECQVVHRIAHPGSHDWFIGEIRAVHLDDDFDKQQALMFWGREYRMVGDLLEPSS